MSCRHFIYDVIKTFRIFVDLAKFWHRIYQNQPYVWHFKWFNMKGLVFSYKIRGEPALYHIPFRKYGPLTKEEIFAMRRKKSMTSPRESDDVITLGDGTDRCRKLNRKIAPRLFHIFHVFFLLLKKPVEKLYGPMFMNRVNTLNHH